MNSITVEHSICIITIDNKPHNYLDYPEFIDTKKLIKIITESNCKAILISGAGRHFSAGADRDNLKKMVANDSVKAEIEKGKNLISTLRSFNIPIVACIEGACFGGGLEIALQADIKIASKKAMFAFPEANIGLIPGLGGTYMIPKITGKAKALEIILKGDIIDTETARDLSIIDQIEEPKSTFDTGLALLTKLINDRPIEIIMAVVETIRNVDILPYEEALGRETELFCHLARNAEKN